MDFNFPELVHFNIPFFALLAMTAAAAGLSFWVYKKTSPAVPDIIKFFLGGLRFLVILSLLILIFKPKIEYWFKEPFVPATAVFIDNSQSMQLNNQSENRQIVLDSTLIKLNDILARDKQVAWYYFNTKIEKYTGDSLYISPRATDFNELFNHIDRIDYQRIVILSDGNHTLGPYPLQGRQYPGQEIYSIGIGQVSSDTDLAVSSVSYPPIAYQSKPQTMNVELRFRGVEAKQTGALRLYSGPMQISRKSITIHPGNSNLNISFEYIPPKIGLNRYRVVLESRIDEQNMANNSYVFVQEVLKRQLKIAIFANTPSYESKFMDFLLAKNPDFQVVNLIRKSGTRYYSDTVIGAADSADIFLLIDYPDNRTQSSVLEHFRRIYSSINPSLLVLHSGQYNLGYLNRVVPNLPFSEKITPLRKAAISSLTINNSHSNSYLAEIFNQESLNQLFWRQAPPVDVQTRLHPDEEAQVIIRGQARNEKHPLFFTYESPRRRMAVLNGIGFWKWHFYMQNDQTLAGGYEKFLTNIVRWLGDKQKRSPFRISTEKKVFYNGEQIKLTGKLINADYQPVHDGRVEFQANWNSHDFQLESIPDSLGNYTAWFMPPGEGSYQIKGRGFKNDILIGDDVVNLEIIPYNPEYIKTTQNDIFLKKIAGMGHGVYLNYSQIDSLSAIFHPKSIMVHKKSEFELWFLPSFLILLIIFISIEWYFRKHYGLV